MTYNLPNNAAIRPDVKMTRRRCFCGNVCLLVLGIVLINLGLSIFIWFDLIYDYLVSSAMSFNVDSEPFRVWRKNDPPLDMDIYLFNWTNPEELKVPGSKPHFVELGPYKFKEVKEKINITWHEHNGTVSYQHKKMYFFDEENSARQLSDVITTINVVPLTIAYQFRYSNRFTKAIFSRSMSALSSLHVTKTAGEILFDGYQESMLSALTILPLTGVNDDRFGLFYGKNNTMGDDGFFSMHTKNDENFGKLATWNFKNHSNYFSGNCNAIKGSAGEFYPINQKKDYIELFSSELCKYAKLEYEKEVLVKGVRGYKYTAKNIFDNGTLRPENACYCTGECEPSGVFNVSSCRQNSPTFLSFPHFYNADPYYTNAVEGVSPQDSHEFYITLEPKSGIVIDIAASMQVNMLLQPVDGVEMYQDVPRVFIPMFYFNQSIIVDDELAPILILIQDLPDFSNKAVLILVTLGIMSLIWVGLNVYCNSKNKRYNDDDCKIPEYPENIPLRS